MMDTELIRESIIRDMSEGVMTIGLDGVIASMNPAAETILDRSAGELVGKRFAAAFFEHEENDAFNQTVLDAIYAPDASHENYVSFFTGTITKQLHVTTSFLHNDTERVALIAVLSDISELEELRDAVKAMERIKALNAQLELRNQLLSETFGRFLSDEIVRQLLETPDGLALGGKKRSLTILMSDLRGFTALSERMAPGDLISMLNHYLGEMTEIIQGNGGTIIEFIGDGIMALFGAPVPLEAHAAGAVRSAVEMQCRMKAVNEWNASHGFPVLQMGIGINTGEVIVGNIGSEKRTKYGVVGSHVNLAGRIESYTVGGEILVSPKTRAEISEKLEIAEERSVIPKGVAEPLVLSSVTGIGGSCFHAKLDAPVPLEQPIPVQFLKIHEKHIGKVLNAGVFTALSDAGAALETKTPLEPYENLEIEAGGKLLCKVVSRQGSGWLLRFTSVPDGFKRWRGETGSVTSEQAQTANAALFK